MISLERVNFSYRDRVIFQNLTCQFENKIFNCILGKNGSGKSTLLKIINGFYKPESGSIKVFERDKENISLSDYTKIVGYLPQFHQPLYPFKVIDVVLTGRMPYFKFYPSKKDMDFALSALERLNIMDFRDRKYTELSGGEQKLVLLARVLAQNPQIIMLDEPLTNLDLHNQIDVLKILKDLVKDGKTIITVIHEISLSLAFGDKFYFLKDGSIFVKEKEEINEEFLNFIFDVNFKILNDKNMYVVPCI